MLRLRGKKHQEIEEMSQNLSNLSVGLGTFFTILGIFVIKTFYFFLKKILNANLSRIRCPWSDIDKNWFVME